MFRFLSFLLILAGLAATAYGGYRYLDADKQGERSASVSSDVAPGFDSASTPVQPPATRSLSKSLDAPAESISDDIIGTESVSNDFLSSLQSVPIAHETPTRAQFGRPFEVTVCLLYTSPSPRDA